MGVTYTSKRNGFNKIGNLEELQRYLFFFQQETLDWSGCKNWGSAAVKANQVWPQCAYFVKMWLSLLNETS